MQYIISKTFAEPNYNPRDNRQWSYKVKCFGGFQNSPYGKAEWWTDRKNAQVFDSKEEAERIVKELGLDLIVNGFKLN